MPGPATQHSLKSPASVPQAALRSLAAASLSHGSTFGSIPPCQKENHCCFYEPLLADLLQSSSLEKDLGVLVGNEFAMSQQCALTAKSILGGIKKSIASRSGKFYCPSAHPWIGHIWITLSISGLPGSRETENYHRESTEATKC